MTKLAILIPAYNEEMTIKDVILDFHTYLSKSDYDYRIYIIDNNSNDQTNNISKKVILENKIPADVTFVKRQGKANAVREALWSIDADVYIMTDADSTYWAEDLGKLIYPIVNNNIDMVIGDRISGGLYKQENKRPLHDSGNSLVKKLINFIFKANLSDIMTGYRAFSRRMIKNYPIICEGFELETDMTIFCLEHRLNIIEVPIKFTDRPSGSFSKLNTFRDGFKVIVTIFDLFRNYRPMMFFGLISLLLMLIALILGAFPVLEYIEFHYIYKIPTAILSVGVAVLSVLSFSIALILDHAKRFQNIIFETNLLKDLK